MKLHGTEYAIRITQYALMGKNCQLCSRLPIHVESAHSTTRFIVLPLKPTYLSRTMRP